MFYANHSFMDWFFSTPYQRRKWSNQADKRVNAVATTSAPVITGSLMIKHSINSYQSIVVDGLLESASTRSIEHQGYHIFRSHNFSGYDIKRWGGLIFRVQITGDNAVIYRRDFRRAGKLGVISYVPTTIIFQTIEPLSSMLERSDFEEKH